LEFYFHKYLFKEEKVTMEEQSGKHDSPSIEEKATQEDGHDELGEEAEDEEEEEEEGIRKRNILPENSTDDEEEEEITTMEMRKERIDKVVVYTFIHYFWIL
jgi:hypothetical protein